MRVYISYAVEDEWQAKTLVSLFSENKEITIYSTAEDKGDLEPDEKNKITNKALRAQLSSIYQLMDVFIILLTDNAFKSKYVNREISDLIINNWGKRGLC